MGVEPGQSGYAPKLPFWIDTDAYSDRDRAMFTAGFEFALVSFLMEHQDGGCERPIHRENESRVRMAAGLFKRKVDLTCFTPAEDPSGAWTHLSIHPR